METLDIDRKALILANMGLVKKLASRYSISPDRFDNLCQEGYLGLIKAVDSFDAFKGFQFSTYAARCIKQFMTDAIQDSKHIVKFTKREEKPWSDVLRELIALDKYPNHTEASAISKKYGVEQETVERYASNMHTSSVSYTEGTREDSEQGLYVSKCDVGYNSTLEVHEVSNIVSTNEEFSLVRNAIKHKIPKEDREHLTKWLLADGPSYHEMAKLEGVSHTSIRWRHNRAIKAVRNAIGLSINTSGVE